MNMRKFLNLFIALMLILAPLINFESSEDTDIFSTVTIFGSQVGEGCGNETRDDGSPYFVNINLGNKVSTDIIAKSIAIPVNKPK